MLRASCYNIYVDLPNNEQDVLLVHGYSGAYDKVSRSVATYVRSLESGHPPKPLYGDWGPEPSIEEVIPPSEETCKVLKRRGYLTEKTVEEEEALFVKMAEAIHRSAKRRMPGYIFMPTYDCNFRCPYCYQDHMRTEPEFEHLMGKTMQPELVDRIFAAMQQIENHHGVPEKKRSRHSISFYGGEPLLEKNRPIVEYIINKALAMGKSSFSAVTNAAELDAYQDLLGPDRISFLQITLDGPPEEHNKRRIYVDGSGSFERVARNITMALERNVRVSVRMNIDLNNVHHLPALSDEIIARGWHRYKKFSPYTYAIHKSNKKIDGKTTTSLWALDKELSEMRRQNPNMWVIKRPDDRLKGRIRTIFDKQSNPLPGFKASYCSAHVGMYLFDPFGDIYVCWERTGDPQERIGYISQDGDLVLDAESEQTWRSRTVTTNSICRRCRYAFYCGGGCVARAMGTYNEFFANYCDGFATRFRASTAEAYLDFVAGIKPAAKPEEDCRV